MEIIAYEMKFFEDTLSENAEITCIPFDSRYFEEYKKIYNECFYDMRKSLNIKPYDFLSNYQQISEKIRGIYLLLHKDEIIGSVACYGNEIDDLIVNKKFQNKGYGKQLLLWGMKHIRKNNTEPITLHVAEWNKKAIKMYVGMGFANSNIEKVR